MDDAQVVLLSTLLVLDADFDQLEILASERPNILTQSVLCRLLLSYLPILSEIESRLAIFLSHIQKSFQDVSALDLPVDTRQVEQLSKLEVSKRLHQLRLNTGATQSSIQADDEMSNFVIHYIRRSELLAGLSPRLMDIVDAVVDTRPHLRQWRDTYLAPLLKLQSDFYPVRADAIDLSTMEELQGMHGVKILLQFAEQDGEASQIGRDLDEIVTPWVQGVSGRKRRRISELSTSQTTQGIASWQDVSEWLLTTSRTNFPLAAKAVLEWNGPCPEISQGNAPPTSAHGSQAMYAQTALAMVLHSPSVNPENAPLTRSILDRVAALAGSFLHQDTHGSFLEKCSRADLLENSALRPDNPLTTPSRDSLAVLDSCLSDQMTLMQTFNITMTIASLADLALFGTEEKQKQEVSHLLQQALRTNRTEVHWSRIRDALLSLRNNARLDCNAEQHSVPQILARAPTDYIESELLDAVLTSDQYRVAKGIYLDSTRHPLAPDLVQNRVILAIYTAYDNASNGNRTRGSIKRASDLLKTFQPNFPTAEEFDRIEHLIKATHSLSFYQLTLQHGVPFRPVNIRVHRDPLSLLDQVLRQTSKSYTKLDDLVEIGRSLVRAGLPQTRNDDESQSLEEKLFHATHRVTYLAIRAALADHDFDTAYSYITTRLSTSPLQPSDGHFVDDTSWRAAFEAGRYNPAGSPKNLHDRIASLAQRMDLLSLALTLTPTSDTLPEILSVWSRCEAEMDGLRARAVDEERAFEAQSESIIPGGFEPGERELDAAETRRLQEKRVMNGTSPSYEEEAPMGLFDVARGAASALRKSTFPLRGNGRGGLGGDGFKIRQAVAPESPRSSADESREGLDANQPRVRKRDMVSNMVTGRLVSGMSWVLGAPPAGGRSGNEHDDQ